nr:uncharacterized protein LOC125969396 isoform X8 [Syngnathus scovelli]XP_049577361.1 uncharacterized protein LOC125969396 isoform X9 [Syngnathus scovelli]
MKCSGGGVSRKQRHKLYFSFCAHCWRGSRRNVAEIQEWLLILTSTSVKVMAVAVSRDLSVQVLEDQNTVKLTDRQQYLHDAKQCGQSKCIGVSQVVLGLMIMSYAIPLHFINHTEVVYLGVPWWSGLVFITAGVVAIILDKHCTTRTTSPSPQQVKRCCLELPDLLQSKKVVDVCTCHFVYALFSHDYFVSHNILSLHTFRFSWDPVRDF